ncbi:MAG: DMT family transporter [Dehalococcoidia bacterium]|uniref:DMT family transporter n=1 Tax=Candidatus Amarobacter glycogenicus TaxID=3140699 RepID=UPI0031371E38|nr:DMT family transporter [Dehalococcoidia bacterium]
MTRRQFAILLALALTWGCSFLFIKVIVDAGVAPMGMSGVRTALGAATLLPFAWRARKGFRQSRATWLGLAGLGALNFAIPWTIFGIAEKHVPSGAAAVANACTPLWSAILATTLLKADSLGPQRIAGLSLGFAGVLVLMGRDLANLSGSEAASILLVVVATFCYAVSAVSIRRWLGHVPAVPLATAQVATAAVLLLPAAFLTGAFEGAELTPRVVGSVAALGAFGSGIAVVAYMYPHPAGRPRACVGGHLPRASRGRAPRLAVPGGSGGLEPPRGPGMHPCRGRPRARHQPPAYRRAVPGIRDGGGGSAGLTHARRDRLW